jgi:hypothetical protein
MNSENPSPLCPPVYSKLKNLCLATDLVRNGEPAVTIVVPQGGNYDTQAALVRMAIEEISGVRAPIVSDHCEQGRFPCQQNLILLGNRSTNSAIRVLYDLFYTLLDLRYPGPGGYVVRSLHNPFGDGGNVIFLGGSDTEGVSAATDAFCRILGRQPKNTGCLTVGRLAEIRLGNGMNPPRDIREIKTWEDSPEYQSRGLFVWNSISKHMAMYYMTGEEHHAREVLRLSFPDEAAKQEITEIDGELIENKEDPLSGPYHYAALMLILFWDLIEESPVFTDADRLRITNAFSRQLAHPQEQGWREGVYSRFGRGEAAFADPPEDLDNRHGCFSHLALYALSRYFQKYYPHPLWRHCLDGANWYFSLLQRPCHIKTLFAVEKDWFSSYISPILTYTILSGNRVAVDSGALAHFLLGQEIIISGRVADPPMQASDSDCVDPGLRSASVDYFHKAAYLTGDGRFLEYLRRIGMDSENFHIGQSFWPEPGLRPRQPDDLAGRWSMLPMPERQWRQRRSSVEQRESFLAGSFRNAVDGSGDYFCFETFRESERYHTFDISALQIIGRLVLERGNNHLFARADGLAPPEVSQDSAIGTACVVGDHALIQADVVRAGAARWRRTVLLRDSRFALIVDRVTFTDSSENGEVSILWQGPGDWSALPGEGAIQTRYQDSIYDIRACDDLEMTVSENRWGTSRGRMIWRGAVDNGSPATFFSLIAESGESSVVSCRRLDDHTALLHLPSLSLVTAGGCDGIVGELVLISQNHLFGKATRVVNLDAVLLQADLPVQVDWDFKNGVLELEAENDMEICFDVMNQNDLMVDGSPVGNGRTENELVSLQIPSGKHEIRGAIPSPLALKALGEYLQRQQKVVPESAKQQQTPPITKRQPSGTVNVGEPIVAMVAVPEIGRGTIYTAAGERVHVWTPSSGQLQVLPADSAVQSLHYWAEPKLLLAGCKNDEVIAFDVQTGRRRWTFVSETDPAVYRAGKPYWFRNAKGHEGIHGLHTGLFYQGESQAFIGSACTVEIIDAQGQLLSRLPVFWGPCHAFCLVDVPDGSINLLVARNPADTHAAVVVNNRQEYVPNMLGPDPFSFYDIPPGHTDISAWGQTTRNTFLHDDIDGDGRKEIISDIDGAWNRVTVWSDDARPLYNANFGPGSSIREPEKTETTMRGLAIAALDGSGQKAILTATVGGWVVALNHRCQKIWARRLNATPVTLKARDAGAETRIVVACEDGDIYFLDALGDIVAQAQVSGKPVCMEFYRQEMIIGVDNGALEIIHTA